MVLRWEEAGGHPRGQRGRTRAASEVGPWRLGASKLRRIFDGASNPRDAPSALVNLIGARCRRGR